MQLCAVGALDKLFEYYLAGCCDSRIHGTFGNFSTNPCRCVHVQNYILRGMFTRVRTCAYTCSRARARCSHYTCVRSQQPHDPNCSKDYVIKLTHVRRAATSSCQGIICLFCVVVVVVGTCERTRVGMLAHSNSDTDTHTRKPTTHSHLTIPG